MKIGFVTANFGGIDSVKPLPEHNGIDCYYYSDSVYEHENPISKTWTKLINPNYPRYDLNPRVKAKYFKCQIHRIDDVADYDYLVWSDACQLHHSMDYIHQGIKAMFSAPENQRLLVVPHPFGWPNPCNTIQNEYNGIIEQMETNEYLKIRYEKEMLHEQIAYYKSLGWDLNKIECYASTCFVVENSSRYHDMLNYWWDQNLKWGITDQLSWPIAIAKAGISPMKLNVLLWQNQFFTHIGHTKLM